jgi:arylsulfatase A-like enzyme
MRLWIWLWVLFVAPFPIVAETGVRGSHRVVLVVWDGMRPDFVTSEDTPTLWKLAGDGVIFRNHHSAYFSATNVNGTVLATGMYPARTGLIANLEFRPSINSHKPIDVSLSKIVSKGDELSHGNYIGAPTVAELVQKAGQRTVVAASKTVGLLHDRALSIGQRQGSVTLSDGAVWPNELGSTITAALGPFPKAHSEKDQWTTKALTEILWKNDVPVFSVLWLGEPDLTEHETAPGSPAALRAIRESDDNLAAMLEALDRHRLRPNTDVIVVSDHGFSTIARQIKLPQILAHAGFDAATEFQSEPRPGQILVVGGGGSVLFYVVQHDPAVIRRLVEFLQRTDFAGVIFTRERLDGTFSLAEAKIDSRDAPDVIMSFRWMDQPNQFGIPGMIDADWQRAAGKGTHATLSRFDMHNTLIAAGPDFRHGQADDLPTGNVDVAPTILQILRVPTPHPMDGRVLSEALVNADQHPLKVDTDTIKADRQFPTGRWHQTLRISRVANTLYLDEGNGAFEKAGGTSSPGQP